jgi:CubicO group peptidase (beta-lactamase class C family)
MTLILDLPRKLDQQLQREADSQGVAKEILAIDLIARSLEDTGGRSPEIKEGKGGTDFWSPIDVEALAQEQGVKPIEDFASIVSMILRDDTRAAHYAPYLDGFRQCVSFQSIDEMREGALVSNWGERRRQELEEFLRQFVILPFVDGFASEWARIRAAGRRAGARLEAGNAWIAATAAALCQPRTMPMSDLYMREARSEPPTQGRRDWRRRMPALCALVVVTRAGICRADSVDDFVRQQMSKRDICGLSLAVIEGGKIVKAKGYGFTDRSRRQPVTKETLFQAGSVSKPVAAVAALRLIEQGKLSLDEDVNRRLVSWKLPESSLTQMEPVTVRRILSHSAGLSVSGFPGYEAGTPRPTLLQVLNGEKPCNTPAVRIQKRPGSEWRYSGGGYTILQLMMQEIVGKPFPDLMKESVLDPLGMEQSTFAQPLPPEMARMAAAGYFPEAKPVKGRWHVYPEMAAAGLWTNPSDLARFAIGVQRAYTGGQDALLSQPMARQMLSYQKADDGLGFFLQSSGPTLRFVHNGRDAGFDALLSAYAESGQGAVIMINANDDSQMVVRILEAIATQYRWPGFPIQPAYTPITDREPAVTSRVRAVFERLAGGHVDRDQIAPQLAGLLAARLKSDIAPFLKRLGKMRDLRLVERRNEGASRLYRYRLVFAKQTWLLPCAFNREGKLSSLSFEPE